MLQDRPLRVTKAALRYLKSAPEGPYKDMIIGLVSRIEDLRYTEDILRGELQDLKVEARAQAVKMMVFEDGGFMVFSEEERMVDWFHDNFIGDPEE